MGRDKKVFSSKKIYYRMHSTFTTLTDIVCSCLTFDKQQGWNDSMSALSVKWRTYSLR